MPYKRIGKKILVKKGGKWKIKAVASSVAKAIRMLRLLRGVEHDWSPKNT